MKIIPNKVNALDRAIEEVYPFKGYASTLRRRLNNFLEEYLKITKSFLIEEKYIEWEWRESYSIHYSKTFYENITPYVCRIHFISDNIEKIESVSDENYLGYITLRPVPSPNHALSRIRLRPLKGIYYLQKKESLYLMTATYNVNFPNKKLKINVFPFYAQDSMVCVCAHADILMMSEFMHKKHGLDRPKIQGFLEELIPMSGRTVPSEGLSIEQIMISLQKNNYPANLVMFENGKEKRSGIEAVDYIDVLIESCIPCILAFDEHVIIFAGHTLIEKEGRPDIRYVIFDDSGYHIRNTFKKGEKYTCIISKSELMEALRGKDSNESKNSFLIFIEFDKVFYGYRYLYYYILNRLKEISPELAPLETRSLIIDSSFLKQILNKNGITTFNDVPLPHYVWLTEWYNGKRGKTHDLMYLSLVNAASHKYDYKYSLLKDKEGKCLISWKGKNPVGLLRKI